MRASERCTEHFQGDRCREPRGHASSLAISPDPQHAGQFNVWEGEGDSKRLLKGTVNRFKRNRQVNRAYRRIACAKQEDLNLIGTKERPLYKAVLESIFNHFKRSNS